ncbi:carboxypeptidase regulatory-like domain-containing protein [Streptomyces sp. WAC 04229]|uniref:carboxypeptidase regulatory-like domain-containing protein n=1 Tax=Streptomyces sp. WAC 04229 TaxID=2203206 RepID=UPI0021ADDF2B|nr:carboxypeptidase regulatory-like domain-containing protein [Streptomyces sp. WAC 04229]
MIKVSVYRDRTLIEKAYTSDEGRYSVDVPRGELVTVRFDTHHSLTNAEDWHPSVVTNVIADDESPINRYLLKSGHGVDPESAMDALSGYLFATEWEDEDYARTAESRLSRLKQTSEVLQGIQRNLQEYFKARAT